MWPRILLALFSLIFLFTNKFHSNAQASEETKSVLENIIEVNQGNGILLKPNFTFGDRGVFEGDIRLHRRTHKIVFGNDLSVGYGSTGLIEDLWPDRTVYYTISDEIMNEEGGATFAAINSGIKEINSKTCIRIIQRTSEKHYVHFFKGDGCWSMIGRVGGKQLLSIGMRCEHKGIVIHELMHAIGFWHEQSRPDRDKFVEIVYENVLDGYASQFKKYDTGEINSLGSPYDYGSVMHYGARAFSKNGLETIRIMNSTESKTLGQREGLSENDIKQLALLYKCTNDPVDGKFGPWSEWLPCDRSCDGGIQTRSRSCNSPPPKFGGKDCDGDTYETHACNTFACTVDDHFCNFEYKCKAWKRGKSKIRWSPRSGRTPTPYTGPLTDHTFQNRKGHYIYMESTTTCKKGEIARLVSKPFDAGEKSCLKFYYFMFGNTIGQLNIYWKNLIGKGEILLWSLKGNQGQGWKLANVPLLSTDFPFQLIIEGKIDSSCFSDIAIDDIFFDVAACKTMPPGAKVVVVATPLQNSVQTTTQATIPPTATLRVDGGWSGWTGYDECTVKCGGGTQKRTRGCNNPPPMYEGNNCKGEAIDSRACNTMPCPVDGGYTGWSSYGACSKSCGGGRRYRSRTCTKPRPAHGGKNCQRYGPATESRPCNQNACPIKQYSKHCCEDDSVYLSCVGSDRISIRHAFYGRQTRSICKHWASLFLRTNCRAGNSKHIVSAACNGKKACRVYAKNSVFGDPCWGTPKYLQVTYRCQ